MTRPAPSPTPAPLLERLPHVRGKLTADAPLQSLSWFRTGGTADVLFQPSDPDDLAAFLQGCPREIPLTVLGFGSNLLIRDGGVRGVVVKMGAGFRDIDVQGMHVTAGAAATDLAVARSAQKAGLDGLAFLSGIPGTVGGALRMNAGAYGGDIASIFVQAVALDRAGSRHTLSADAMGFSYRHTSVPEDWLFLSGTFEGQAGVSEAIAEKMDTIAAAREASQPIRMRTGGSTFANPENDPQGRKAWQLIDAVGGRGLARGDAMVSEKHCNFLINRGNATAADIEGLGEELRRRVKDSFGIDLRWEIRRIGDPLPAGKEA